MMLEMASMPRHFAPGAGCCPAGVSGQNLPLPYMPVSCGGKLRLLRQQLRVLRRGRRIQLQQA